MVMLKAEQAMQQTRRPLSCSKQIQSKIKSSHNSVGLHVPFKAKVAQAGIGLVEVLVALLLLAVAALGYTALQGQALSSTDESLTRTQAITLIRTAAESIRTNAIGATYIKADTSDPVAAMAQIKSAIDQYQTLFAQTTLPDAIACPAKGCTPAQAAANDVRTIRQNANTLGIKLGIITCPGTSTQAKTHCIVAAWNTTTPTIGGGVNDCINSQGVYGFKSNCVYMEAY